MTSAQLKALKESIPTVTNLFANGDGTPSQIGWNDPFDNDQGARLINWTEGIPPDYATPESNGGKKVLRKDVNAIGNIASRELYLLQHGGYHTFDMRVAEAIGGYPYGAFLDWYQPSTGWLRKVRCVKSGGNCYTPIDDPDNGIGSSQPHWEIADVMDEYALDGSSTVNTIAAPVPEGGIGGAFWGGYVLHIPEGTTIQSGQTAKSATWTAPFNAKFSLPFIREGALNPRDNSNFYCFNPYVLVVDNGVASALNSRFYLEVTGVSGDVLEIPTAKNITPTTGEPASNSGYRSFVESMYMTIPRMFIKKGTKIRFCCTNMSPSGQMEVYGYAKFDLEEVV